MTLQIVQSQANGTGGKNENLINPRYWLHYELPDQIHVYDFTGGLTLNFKSSHSSTYDYEDVLLDLWIEACG